MFGIEYSGNHRTLNFDNITDMLQYNPTQIQTIVRYMLAAGEVAAEDQIPAEYFLNNFAPENQYAQTGAQTPREFLRRVAER